MSSPWQCKALPCISFPTFLMRRSLRYVVAASVALGLLLSTSALAAPPPTAPGQDKLLCFDGTTDGGYGGVCTLKANGAKGPATLDNTDSNPNGDYSGVYIQNSTLFGQTLSQVKQLGYHYTGTVTPMPGNLSLNVPLSTGGYAFVDAYYCPGTNGNVDIINDANCGIWYNSTEYANWAALAAAYPTATINDLAFIVAERTPSEVPALWTVSNVKLGKAGK